jgi:hypothetical protein
MSGFLGDRYVMVNIPAAQIEAVENGLCRAAPHCDCRQDRPPDADPQFEDPRDHSQSYWTSPRSIIEKDIVPLMRKDPTYLSRN